MKEELTDSNISFSKNVKVELAHSIPADLTSAVWELMALHMSCGHIANNRTCYKHLSSDNMIYFKQLLEVFVPSEQILMSGSGSHTIEMAVNILAQLQSEDKFRRVSALFFDDEARMNQISKNDMKRFDQHTLEKGVRCFMKAQFLLCGSMSNPLHAYHFSFSCKQENAAEITRMLLAEIDLSCKIIRKDELFIVYNKESQFISDFLINIGAHRALLDFESLRVEKELRNNVNRVVNCDSANTQRIANTGARQAALINIIEKSIGLQSLPEDLHEVALLRKDNPDLSLKELGEIAQPPLGKSGVYRRLRKIEKFLKSQIEDD